MQVRPGISVDETTRGWVARSDSPRLAAFCETEEAAVQELERRLEIVERLGGRQNPRSEVGEPI